MAPTNEGKTVLPQDKEPCASPVASKIAFYFSEPMVKSFFVAGALSGFALFGRWTIGSRLASWIQRLVATTGIPGSFYTGGSSALATVLGFFLVRKLASGGGLSRSLKKSTNLSGKNAVITGATSGIGKEAARQLCCWGAKVIIGCRDIRRANAVIEEIKKEASLPHDSTQIIALPLDLAHLDSVRHFAAKLLSLDCKIDYLINNAGVMSTSCNQRSKDGFELHFATNHLGHFLLTTLLLDSLKKSNARVITISSLMHGIGSLFNKSPELRELESEDYDHMQRRYSVSKLYNIWFTNQLQRIFDADPDTTATAYSVHPGVIRSELARDFHTIFRFLLNFVSPLFMKSTVEGSQTTLYLCAESLDKLPSGYYQDCKLAKVSPVAKFMNEKERELWAYSEELIESVKGN